MKNNSTENLIRPALNLNFAPDLNFANFRHLDHSAYGYYAQVQINNSQQYSCKPRECMDDTLKPSILLPALHSHAA